MLLQENILVPVRLGSFYLCLCLSSSIFLLVFGFQENKLFKVYYFPWIENSGGGCQHKSIYKYI